MRQPAVRDKGEARVATYCECGASLVGFAGVLVCSKCGVAWSIARMRLGQL